MKGNYQTFYKKAIQEKTGYVTKDGSWAAVPLMNSKQFAIINNGEWVHTSKNFDFAKSYIIKENRRR
tara:strand:- start:92 stop:292 length:201 start_codon:yes stop_codon:yes gene_type:complete